MSASRRWRSRQPEIAFRMTTMYGATETQGITVVHWITERVGLIGLPLPGITLKLVPNGTKLEVRVKGPTVTPGYLNRPDLTKAAFDEEDYYSLGDAAKFLDEDDPDAGAGVRRPRDRGLQARLRHLGVGRHAAGAGHGGGVSPDSGLRRLRSGQAVRGAAGLAQHCGGQGDCAPTPSRSSPDEIVNSPKVRAFVQGSSPRTTSIAAAPRGKVKRILLMTEPPSVDGHEITDKGYINQRATLERRKTLVELLYAASPAGRRDRDRLMGTLLGIARARSRLAIRWRSGSRH